MVNKKVIQKRIDDKTFELSNYNKDLLLADGRKILNNETNLRKYIDVEIAPKIAGKDDFTKSTKAKIQVR